MPVRESLLDRFCRYVQIDTQSNDQSSTYPSTEGQKNLLQILVTDLQAAGLEDAAIDEHGYVMATVPSNSPDNHPAHGKVPTLGLLAHVDTYHEVSGKNVKPVVHRNYDGGDLALPGDPSIVLKAAEEPELAACRGMTIVTADGTTLLGADDKAGVSEILEVLWRLKEDPSRLHGRIRVAFTPDEEIGKGTLHFDVKRFGADYAYTVDGSGLGSIEAESFCADSAHVTVTGVDVHPGYAKGKMTNAVRVMSEIILALPQDRTPETTEGREGYLHPITMSGNVSEVRAHFLVRDYAEEGLHELADVLRRAAATVGERYPAARISVTVEESYRNMKYVIDREPKVVEYAEEAVRRAGVTPRHESIRGGTDGARLSYEGLLTPNLFDGSMNFHGKKEWVPLEWMDKAVETVLNLLEVWVEKSR